MKCENCGKENPPDVKFCENCGNILSREEPVAQPDAPVPAAVPAPAEPAVPETPEAPVAPAEAPSPAPAQPNSPVPLTKVLVLPDSTEILLGVKKTFGRIDFAKQATEPMWISRQHFTVFEEEGVCYIQDEGSSNGTRLNGKELKQAGKQALKDGDEIVVGDAIKLVFKTK